MFSPEEEDKRDENLDLTFASDANNNVNFGLNIGNISLIEQGKAGKQNYNNSNNNNNNNKGGNTEGDISLEEEKIDGLNFSCHDLFNNADHLGLPEFNMIQDAPPDPVDNSFNNINMNPESSPDLIPLFQFMQQFQPPDLDITPHFKPFLPDLVPSIGSIDAFIKITRPDNQIDDLGLTVLDEPSIAQANSQILIMELREKFQVSANTNHGDAFVGKLDKSSIKTAADREKAIGSFVEAIDEIHRNRPPPTMTYSAKMPDLEELMELWPDELENALGSLPLPNADIDLSVEEYVRVICAILEIPIKGNMVESLHVLFSLFAQFEGNQYFQSQNPEK